MKLRFFSDSRRHLVCQPYSIPNLHEMANILNIKRCWFHRDHYDLPKRRALLISYSTIRVSPRDIVRIIQGETV